MKSKTKIIIFITFNTILLIFLWNIPIQSDYLNNICLIKMMSGKSCWNCGMTRAFLSILHLKINEAYHYNHNVVMVFPMTVIVYTYSWCKYIFKEQR